MCKVTSFQKMLDQCSPRSCHALCSRARQMRQVALRASGILLRLGLVRHGGRSINYHISVVYTSYIPYQTLSIAVSTFLRLQVMVTDMSKDPSFLTHHDWGVLTISLLSRNKCIKSAVINVR